MAHLDKGTPRVQKTKPPPQSKPPRLCGRGDSWHEERGARQSWRDDALILIPEIRSMAARKFQPSAIQTRTRFWSLQPLWCEGWVVGCMPYAPSLTQILLPSLSAQEEDETVEGRKETRVQELRGR